MAFDISKFAEGIEREPAVVSDSDTEMRWVKTEDIHKNPRNFYPLPVPSELETLKESIQANGLLEPPAVILDTERGGYRLISGHSRMMAVQMLHNDTPADERWQQVLCRVLPPMTEGQELSAVIEANRQRKKDGFILQQEAERLTEAYIKRKEAGEELPGRIRDRVADALQVSRTKLANLKVINEGLILQGFIDRWKGNNLPEAVALEIARLDYNAQCRLSDWAIAHGHDYTIRTVGRFKILWMCCQHECPETGQMCKNADAMYDKYYYGGAWHCGNCCKSCIKNEICPVSCEYIQKPEVAAPEKPKRSPVLDDPRLDNIGQTLGDRLKTARLAAGMDRKEFAESLNLYQATYSAWENGDMPGGSRIPALALALGVTTDYLLGLTDDPASSGAPPAMWIPLDADHWPKEGQLLVLAGPNGIGGADYQMARCVAGPNDRYPFIDPSDDLTVDEFVEREYGFAVWWPLEEADV